MYGVTFELLLQPEVTRVMASILRKILPQKFDTLGLNLEPPLKLSLYNNGL